MVISRKCLLTAGVCLYVLVSRHAYAETGVRVVFDPRPRGADPEPQMPDMTKWEVYGHARLRVVGMQDFSLDSLGTTAGRSLWGESRLIAGGRYDFGPRISAVLEIDALNGQFAGDYTDVGTVRGEDSFRFARHKAFGGAIVLPRKAYVQFDTPAGRLILGQQSFNWGLGLLANDGAGEAQFGDAYQGSLVERIGLFSRPWAYRYDVPAGIRNMALFAAVDVPFRDDNASLIDGDVAVAWVAGMRTKTDRAELGFFVSQRKQWDRDDPGHPQSPGVHVGIVDMYGRFFLTDPQAVESLQFETEMAFIGGNTTRPYQEQTFKNGATVTSFGGVWRLRYDNDQAHTTTKLEVGYASGDQDAQDARFHQFAFNSDYNVGLILFDQYLPMLTARSVDRLADPGLTGIPPAGARHLINQGAVSNATYFHPTIRWRPIPPLDLRAGWLVARADTDVVDPYNTAKNGGYNMSYGNRTPNSRMLGQEVDVSVRYQFKLGKRVQLFVGAEGGVFLPENAFDGVADKNPVWMARGLTDVRF
jgi:hypothetical protein